MKRKARANILWSITRAITSTCYGKTEQIVVVPLNKNNGPFKIGGFFCTPCIFSILCTKLCQITNLKKQHDQSPGIMILSLHWSRNKYYRTVLRIEVAILRRTRLKTNSVNYAAT